MKALWAVALLLLLPSADAQSNSLRLEGPQDIQVQPGTNSTVVLHLSGSLLCTNLGAPTPIYVFASRHGFYTGDNNENRTIWAFEPRAFAVPWVATGQPGGYAVDAALNVTVVSDGAWTSPVVTNMTWLAQAQENSCLPLAGNGFVANLNSTVFVPAMETMAATESAPALPLTFALALLLCAAILRTK